LRRRPADGSLSDPVMAGVILLVLTVVIRAQLSANSSRAHLSGILIGGPRMYRWPLGGFELTLA
jgi:hypothetical protein